MPMPVLHSIQLTEYGLSCNKKDINFAANQLTDDRVLSFAFLTQDSAFERTGLWIHLLLQCKCTTKAKDDSIPVGIPYIFPSLYENPVTQLPFLLDSCDPHPMQVSSVGIISTSYSVRYQ